jgi:hypothetical protein
LNWPIVKYKFFIFPKERTGAMVQPIQFNNQAQSLLLGGLGGFLNGNPIGNQQQNGQHGPMAPRGLGLPLLTQLGVNSNSNPLLSPMRQLQESQKPALEEKDDKKKSDRLDLSDFAEKAAEEALASAKKSPGNGVTNQIIVSEDGQFQASIDLRINADGSYDMDLEVNFAASRAAMLEQFQSTMQEGNLEKSNSSSGLSYTGMQELSQRYTSYEQVLETRGFEARIFFEQANEVSFSAAQMHGQEAGQQYLGVAKQISEEYTLNISISGDDINAFNEVGETLAQFDDTGTLTGFLEAARGVLNADSSNLGSFVEATKALVGSAQEHVSAKLSNFFTSMNGEYGQSLEEMGFEPNFIENIGKDVQADLGNFFSITNEMLSNLFQLPQGSATQDTKTKQIDALNENLDALTEKRKEIIEQKQDELKEQYSQPRLNKPTFEDLVG